MEQARIFRSWKEFTIVPAHKKGDKMDYSKGLFINYVRASRGEGVGKISIYSYFGWEGVKPILFQVYILY